MRVCLGSAIRATRPRRAPSTAASSAAAASATSRWSSLASSLIRRVSAPGTTRARAHVPRRSSRRRPLGANRAARKAGSRSARAHSPARSRRVRALGRARSWCLDGRSAEKRRASGSAAPSSRLVGARSAARARLGRGAGERPPHRRRAIAGHAYGRLAPREPLDHRDEQPGGPHHEHDRRRAQLGQPGGDRERDQERRLEREPQARSSNHVGGRLEAQ